MGNFAEKAYTIITSRIPRQLAIDLLHKYSESIQLNPPVIGHHPIEAPQNAETDEYYGHLARELSSDGPTSGLYLKEDKKIKRNTPMLSFVKKQLRKATDVLIARVVKTAELVDAGISHAMIADGQAEDHQSEQSQDCELRCEPAGSIVGVPAVESIEHSVVHFCGFARTLG